MKAPNSFKEIVQGLGLVFVACVVTSLLMVWLVKSHAPVWPPGVLK